MHAYDPVELYDDNLEPTVVTFWSNRSNFWRSSITGASAGDKGSAYACIV